MNNFDKNKLELYPLHKDYIHGIYEVGIKSLHEAWAEDSLLKELENSMARYIVAVYENRVIGFLGLWLIASEGNITNIAVDSDFRGLGIGNMLMEELQRLCKTENIESVTLEVRESNLVAQNLYKKFGFTEEGRRKNFYANKETAVIMWNRHVD